MAEAEVAFVAVAELGGNGWSRGLEHVDDWLRSTGGFFCHANRRLGLMKNVLGYLKRSDRRITGARPKP